jgi:hypothetical protein
MQILPVGILAVIVLSKSFSSSFPLQSPSCLGRIRKAADQTCVVVATADTNSELLPQRIVDRSTLLLLEHLNFNVPSFHECAVPFYFDILGCGVDPRMAENLDQGEQPEKGSTVWANLGASQFHLCYNDTTTTFPGKIGVWFDSIESLERLSERLRGHEKEASSASKCFQHYSQEKDSQGNLQISIVDKYGNVFVCKFRPPIVNNESPTLFQQPILRASETKQWGELAT